jgi:hypothetical protein
LFCHKSVKFHLFSRNESLQPGAVSHADPAQVANPYFSPMQLDYGKGDYSFFAEYCDCIENGTEATNNNAVTMENALAPQENGGDKSGRQGSEMTGSAASDGRQQFQSGLLQFVVRIRDRRVVVDPKRGIALAFCFFHHAAGKNRAFKLPDDRAITAGHNDSLDVGNRGNLV